MFHKIKISIYIACIKQPRIDWDMVSYSISPSQEVEKYWIPYFGEYINIITSATDFSKCGEWQGHLTRNAFIEITDRTFCEDWIMQESQNWIFKRSGINWQPSSHRLEFNRRYLLDWSVGSWLSYYRHIAKNVSPCKCYQYRWEQNSRRKYWQATCSKTVQ